MEGKDLNLGGQRESEVWPLPGEWAGTGPYCTASAPRKVTRVSFEYSPSLFSVLFDSQLLSAAPRHPFPFPILPTPLFLVLSQLLPDLTHLFSPRHLGPGETKVPRTLVWMINWIRVEIECSRHILVLFPKDVYILRGDDTFLRFQMLVCEREGCCPKLPGS